MIQISSRNIKRGTIRDPHQNSQLIYDPRIRSIYHKNPQSARFLRPNPKPIRPPLFSANISLIPKWQPVYCSFVYIVISPLCLVNMETIKEFEVAMRRRGPITRNMLTKQKNSRLAAIYGIRSRCSTSHLNLTTRTCQLATFI